MTDLPPAEAAEVRVPYDAGQPVLATGLAAFLIANGVGDLSLARETRGAVLDWGGPYAQGVHLTGPWRVEYRVGPIGDFAPLPARQVFRTPGGFRVVRTGPALRVDEIATVHPTEPRMLLTRRVGLVDGGAGVVTVALEFEPLLAPVLLEGIRPVRLQFGGRGPTLHVSASAFGMAYDAEPLTTRAEVNGGPWTGGRFDGRLRSIRLETDLDVPAGGVAEMRSVLAGGRRDRFPFGPVVPSVDLWGAGARASRAQWLARTPTLEIPGAPEVVEGYERARSALRELYTAPEAGFQGLVAGFPWYAALWCRDLARMIPALLWMGDPEWVAASIDTVFRFQAPSSIPILGASTGELPMQVSPGPIFLYGTSDTSLYFPDLVRRYIDHTGDAAGACRWFPGLEAVRRWGAAKLSPTTGLFRHGGEIEGLRDSVSSSARVQLGIDAPDTTIWDSADRRDHAVDLQLLWLQVLRSLSALAPEPSAPPEWARALAQATAFRSALPPRYRWAEESYLFDSIRADGTPVRQLRPNALQWVGHGLLDANAERALVGRALREDLSTPWGLRTLSAKDPGYDPIAYHMGRVWPITSAWAAEAAFRCGEPEAGAAILTRMAQQIVGENGYSNECYRGDRAEAFDSCFLLGFSIAPFLSAIFDGLLGLAPDVPHGVLGISPARPLPWGPMRVLGLPLGSGRVDLELQEDGVTGKWSGPGPLMLAGPRSSVRLTPGVAAQLPGAAVGQLV